MTASRGEQTQLSVPSTELPWSLRAHMPVVGWNKDRQVAMLGPVDTNILCFKATPGPRSSEHLLTEWL